MAAPPSSVQATIYFSDLASGAGTSETYYLTSGTTLAQAAPLVQALVDVRSQMLAVNCNVTHVRLHDLTIPNSAQVLPQNPAGLVEQGSSSTIYNPALYAAGANYFNI